MSKKYGECTTKVKVQPAKALRLKAKVLDPASGKIKASKVNWFNPTTNENEFGVDTCIITLNNLMIVQKPDEIEYAICIVKKINPRAGSCRIKVYRISKDVRDELVESVKWFSARIDIEDVNGDVIASKTIPLDFSRKILGKTYRENHPNSPGKGINRDTGHLARFPIVGYGEGAAVVGNKQKVSHFIVAPRLDARFGANTWDSEVDIGTFNGHTQTREISFSLNDEQIKKARAIKCAVITE